MSQAQIAELQKALETGQSIEAEVEMLRKQKLAADEREDGTVKKQGWGWGAR